MEFNEELFWHADFVVSSISSEVEFMGCDDGDEANGKFVGSKLDVELSIFLLNALAVPPEVVWLSSTSVE